MMRQPIAEKVETLGPNCSALFLRVPLDHVARRVAKVAVHRVPAEHRIGIAEVSRDDRDVLSLPGLRDLCFRDKSFTEWPFSRRRSTA